MDNNRINLIDLG